MICLVEPKPRFLAHSPLKSQKNVPKWHIPKIRQKRYESEICTARSAEGEQSPLPIAHEAGSEVRRRVLYCNKQGTCAASSEGKMGPVAHLSFLGGAGLRWRPLSVSSEAPTEPAGETTPKTPFTHLYLCVLNTIVFAESLSKQKERSK